MNAPSNSLKPGLDELKERLKILGLDVDTDQLQAVETFCLNLAEYNQHTNLVASSDPALVIRQHIVDAWSLVPLIKSSLNDQPGSLIDIGSGAGFPGLILAIACPGLKVVLVESIGKKTKFLQQTVAKLNLEHHVTVLNERAEVLAHQSAYRERFNLATARAVGSLDLIAELTIPFLLTKGRLLAQKSQAQLELEESNAKTALAKLKAQLLEIVPLNTEALGKENAVMLIEKCAPTPNKYPRPAAQLKKSPLGRL